MKTYFTSILFFLSINAYSQIPEYCPQLSDFEIVAGQNYLKMTPPAVANWGVMIYPNYEIVGNQVNVRVLSIYTDETPINSDALVIDGLQEGTYNLILTAYYSPPSGFPPAGIPCPILSGEYVIAGQVRGVPVPSGGRLWIGLLVMLVATSAVVAGRRFYGWRAR